ncbi:MAG: transposase [Methylococcaceae bacterium]|nr:transposase [Methylococcaceae bacterium]
MEGHMVQDHVHMLIRIPPKYSVAEVVGYLKGRAPFPLRGSSAGGSEISTARISGREAAVSTVGFEETQIRAYIKNQEQLDGKGSSEQGRF